MTKKIMMLITFSLVFCVVSVSARTENVTQDIYGAKYLLQFDLNSLVSPIVRGDMYTEHNPEDWYKIYLNYAINIHGNMNVISYGTYLEYVQYWSQFIPVQFLYAIVNESLKQELPIRYTYATSYVESCNYRHFVSLKKNTNGTIDVGLMGLNETNFDTTTKEGRAFIKAHFYFDSEYENIPFDQHNELHILKVCVNYLKTLYYYTGESYRSAAICYNGGTWKWARGIPNPKAVSYGEKVLGISRLHIGFNPSRYTTISPRGIEFVKRTQEVGKGSNAIKFAVSVSATRKIPGRSLSMREGELVPDMFSFYVHGRLGLIGSGTFDMWYDRGAHLVKEVVIEHGVFLGTVSENGLYLVMS